MSNKKIEKLTPEQEARFPEFVKKWTDIGLSTEPADRKMAEEGVKEMYQIAGLKEPKIIWCGSPLSQGITRAIIQKLEADGELKKFRVGENKKASVWDSVGASVRDSVRASVGDSVRASVRDSVRASVGDSVGDSVGASVGASVWDSVRDSVGDSVWDSVWDSVGASVGDSVRDSVRDSVGASVWDSVRDSVGDSVRDSVWDSGYGQHDASWLAFYDFFKEVNKLEEETNKLSGLWKVAKSAGWYLPHENICWISERPKFLSRDPQGRLHNEDRMAIEYPDGWGIYALHGVRMDKELHEKITQRKLSFKEIVALDNMEHRQVAMKYMPPHDFMMGVNAILKDKSERGNELWKVPKESGVFDQDEYFLVYTCPSTGRVYMKGVLPENGEKYGADECQALSHKFSYQEYMTLTCES